MNILCIDIGNTSISYCHIKDDIIGKLNRISPKIYNILQPNAVRTLQNDLVKSNNMVLQMSKISLKNLLQIYWSASNEFIAMKKIFAMKSMQ